MREGICNQYIFGRVVEIKDDYIFVCNEKNTLQIKYSNSNPGFHIGDIIKIKLNNKQINDAEEIFVLNRVKNNPLDSYNSPFNFINKNNKKLLHTLYNRQKFFQSIRSFFTNKDFLELHSPSLVDSPGVELYLEPFSTIYKDHSKKEKMFYLPTSPEFALKEALSAGLEKIFEIAKVFRNNGEDSELHSPEFFMLEWYRAYDGYYTIMDDCENLLKYISKNIYNKDYIEYKNKKCSLKKIERITVKELFWKYKIDLDNYSKNPCRFIDEVCEVLNIQKNNRNYNKLNKDDIFYKLFLSKIEPFLGWENPIIIYEYPLEMSALSNQVKNNPDYAERFELYICGIEIANAFGELIDPEEQEKRFKNILKKRDERNQYQLKMPVRFLNTLKYGLPPCAGIALGIERLFMLFEGLNSIKETNLW